MFYKIVDKTKKYIFNSSKFQSRSRKQFKNKKLRKYTFLMFEIKFEPVSFLVYLKPQCSGLQWATVTVGRVRATPSYPVTPCPALLQVLSSA